ncbi:MAG: NAD(P)/FAD-dependent oxidoreductase, partial [Duncaniella sp.]|nr:NAD(P)/FAD-dependent oxidoreductase [Duncaniella sp.]
SLLIWTAGVTGVGFKIVGDDGTDLSSTILGRGRRWQVDGNCKVKGVDDVYALGDISIMENVDPNFPNGHPQLAQVAIQQGRLVAANLNQMARSGSPHLRTFRYDDKGSMATIGRNRAVVDLKKWHMSGIFAWMVWMFIHLISLLGMRNKLTVLINWIWAYFNYSTSLRLLIHPSRYPIRKRWQNDCQPSLKR